MQRQGIRLFYSYALCEFMVMLLVDTNPNEDGFNFRYHLITFSLGEYTIEYERLDDDPAASAVFTIMSGETKIAEQELNVGIDNITVRGINLNGSESIQTAFKCLNGADLCIKKLIIKRQS